MKKSVDKTKIEKNVRRSVAEMVDHIKSQTKTNLSCQWFSGTPEASIDIW